MRRRTHRNRLFLIFLSMLGIYFLTSDALEAAEISVTTISDAIGVDGRCSLREAIDAANSDTAANDCPAGFGPDVILLQFESAVAIALVGSGEDGNQTGDFDITDDLTIRNTGDNPVIPINGSGLDRVFHVLNGADLTLEGIRVEGGDVSTFGGGIATFDSASHLELLRSVVISNQATLFGGGIYAEGSARLEQSSVESNSAAGGGGIFMGTEKALTLDRSRVIFNDASGGGGGLNLRVLKSRHSAVLRNQAGRFGGGIYWRGEGMAGDVSQMVNSTVAENTCLQDGGGIYFGSLGILELLSSSVAWNIADSDANGTGNAGGIYVGTGQVRVRNTVVAGNDDSSPQPVVPDCFGTLSSLGYNLFSEVDAGDCSITGTQTGNLIGTPATPIDARLGCVEFDPGQPGFVRPEADSPVVDAGDPGGCLDEAGAQLVDDQRGHFRPWDGDLDLQARCDIGAIEQGAPEPGFIFGDGFESGGVGAWSGSSGALLRVFELWPSPLPDRRRGGCTDPERFRIGE